MNTVKDAWENYKAEAVADDCTQGQKNALCAAFWAGAIGLWAILGGKTANLEYSEEAALAIVESINEELTRYAEMLAEWGDDIDVGGLLK